MAYEIILAAQAVADLRRLPAHQRAKVRDALAQHLRHAPTKVSRSRIKRLEGLDHPQFRLRVDDMRVFYDVNAGSVEILAIVAKADAATWLEQMGDSDETDSAN
jgi:mRNA-degrading endonuclease RelE of RelBE toxin-antitoxin system